MLEREREREREEQARWNGKLEYVHGDNDYTFRAAKLDHTPMLNHFNNCCHHIQLGPHGRTRCLAAPIRQTLDN